MSHSLAHTDLGRTGESLTARHARRGLIAAGSLATLLAFGVLGSAAAYAGRSSVHRYVSGHVSVPGYTVAVVGYNGRNAVTGRQSFRVAAPDSTVTLQLINSHGLYAGPVVLGGSSTRSVMGLKVGSGVNVGTITVIADRGYARLARRLPARKLDRARWAYARRGVPIGNGTNFGLVVSRTKGSSKGAGADPAHVGIPNEFDIAVPGTRVIGALAPGTRSANKASASVQCPPPPKPTPPGCTVTPPETKSTSGGAELPGWLNSLSLPINVSVNADAANVTVSDIDSMLEDHLTLALINVPADNGLVELNCNGLTYCSAGGTGVAELEGSAGQIPFPSGAMDPATGLGELVGPLAPAGLLTQAPGNLDDFTLYPHASSSQVGSGDVVTENVTALSGATSQIPTTLGFVFVTTPALASYSDTAGDSGVISYPEPVAAAAGPSTDLGTGGDPIKVAPGPGGDVVVTFNFFRPQRLGVPGAGEPQFMDIGHLNYLISAAVMSGPRRGGSPGCPVAAYSGPSSSLTVVAGAGHHASEGFLVDASADSPATPASPLQVTVDLTKCAGGSLPANQPIRVDLNASAGTASIPTDRTDQLFFLQSTG